MYYLDCRKVKRVIEKTKTDKTCGLWLTKLLGNYTQMRSYEDQYNLIANHDIGENSNNRCAARIVDQDSLSNTLSRLDELRSTEQLRIQEIKNYENQNKSMRKITNIQRNTNKLIKIYEYDYSKDEEIIKPFKFIGKWSIYCY